MSEKDKNIDIELERIENIFNQISNLQDRFNSLLEEINDLYVFGENQQEIEQKIAQLLSIVVQTTAESKRLAQQTQEEYNKSQGFVPADIAQELTGLELLADRLVEAMDAKEREFKRAKTVRSEYVSGVDYIQTWLHQAELRIQDRSTEPSLLRETLNQIQHELSGVQERMDIVKQNGYVIIEKTRNDDEKSIIRQTIDQLEQQIDQIRSWLDDKRHQVGNSLDAWSRFMQLYQAVMAWAAEQKTFIGLPLNVTTLPECRQKMNDYLNAVKSIKPIVRNLVEMDKELDIIAQVTSTGDLRSKLAEAEEVKVDVEAILLERVSVSEKKMNETFIDRIKEKETIQGRFIHDMASRRHIFSSFFFCIYKYSITRFAFFSLSDFFSFSIFLIFFCHTLEYFIARNMRRMGTM